METKVVMVKKFFNEDMLEWYSPDEYEEEIEIHFPAYVNIRKDNQFEVYLSGKHLEIKNSKVWVTLGMDRSWMHIIVFK